VAHVSGGTETGGRVAEESLWHENIYLYACNGVMSASKGRKIVGHRVCDVD